ncbi:MAG: ATP-binding protein, partial [Acidimicrobiales bacterium]
LAALRELALLWVADQVDDGLQAYRERHGIVQPWETKERVVVAVTGSPSGERVVRRGARMAARSHANLIGVHIRPADGLAGTRRDLLDGHQRLLAELGGRYVEVTAAGGVARALVDFALIENASQLLIGSTRRSRWETLSRGSVINQVIRLAGSIDVHVISAGPERGDPGVIGRPRLPRLPPRRRLVALSPRRVITGWLLSVIAMPALAVALVPARQALGPSGALPELLLGGVVVAVTGGLAPGLAGAVLGFGFADWFLIPPVHSLTIGRTGDLVAFLSFLVTAAIVAALIDLLARRGLQQARASSEAEALARLAGRAVLSPEGSLPTLVEELRSTFGAEAVAVLQPDVPGRWSVQEASGTPIPTSPEAAAFSAELTAGSVLVLSGPDLAAEDRPLLAAFVNQLRAAQDQHRLAETAASAQALTQADELRTALLAAVSHDLRTPLASIKACATSLLATDVNWSADAVRSFHQTINAETDRLAHLVANLLDMSRLQTGVLQPALCPVGLEEVVFAALASLSGDTSTVMVDVPETLPAAFVDPALLERAVANLIANARAWSVEGRPVRVVAGIAGDRLDVRIVDRGPGIPEDRRQSVFEPFQRLGDAATTTPDGVGLGLAVARGFVEAVGGEIALEDTPGGGLTAVVSVPTAGPTGPAAPALDPDVARLHRTDRAHQL